ncbi:hypothetical protein PT2222_40015 [Paraburkholderia tropica]
MQRRVLLAGHPLHVLSDQPHGVDIRLAIRRLHDLRGLAIVLVFGGRQGGAVLEAQEQLRLLRFLDRHRERAADVFGGRQDVVAHALVERERHAVAHRGLAVMQLALHRVGFLREDRAAVEADHEQLRLLGAQHEAFPELVACHRQDERVLRVVDLDKVFEIQGNVLCVYVRAPGAPPSGDDEPRADRDRIREHFMHRARVRDLQEALALLLREMAFERDLAVDRGARAAGFHRQFHAHAFERPFLALRVHLQRDRRAGAQARQQQRKGRGPAVAAAERGRFVGDPGVGAVVELDLIVGRADVCGDYGIGHALLANGTVERRTAAAPAIRRATGGQ